MAGASSNNSIDKGLQLLQFFTEEKPSRTLAEISREANMPKATVLRFLTSFTSSGFLRRDSSGGYRLGFRLIELGHLASAQLDLRSVALPFMTALRDELDEAVQIAIVDGREAVYLEKVECRQSVRLYTRAGRRAPLYAGACPRLLLAFANAAVADEVLQSPGGLHRYTESTPTDPAYLRELLIKIRADEYSISFGELEPGSAALAVPIRDYSSRVVATLSVAGPQQRFHPDRIPEILTGARRTAQAISSALGMDVVGASAPCDRSSRIQTST